MTDKQRVSLEEFESRYAQLVKLVVGSVVRSVDVHGTMELRSNGVLICWTTIFDDWRRRRVKAAVAPL